jgi:CCR4-NOT transcription complex subunit 7/8
LGITLADEEGNLPQPTHTWQFNFRFDLSRDNFNPESIEMLKAAGLDFDKHAALGIGHEQFSQLLRKSGLLANQSLTWAAFNSSFDFAYMIKVLRSGQDLPKCKFDFLKQCNQFFPTFYDVKQLEISTGSLAE